MPVNTDNPAGRLLVLLRQAKSYPNVSTCLHVWAQVFDLSINDNHQQYELMLRIWEINQLIDDLEQQIQSLEDDDDRESFLQPIKGSEMPYPSRRLRIRIYNRPSDRSLMVT